MRQRAGVTLCCADGFPFSTVRTGQRRCQTLFVKPSGKSATRKWPNFAALLKKKKCADLESQSRSDFTPVRSQDGFSPPMPKEYKRRTSKEFSLSGTATDEGSRLGSEHGGGSSHQDDDQTPLSSMRMDTHPVPQVTITPEGSGCSREMQQKDWEDMVEGPLRRNLSSSSISSTGSSAVESEDDLLSDSESKSKGLVTLENLVDAGEVRTGWSEQQQTTKNNNLI